MQQENTDAETYEKNDILELDLIEEMVLHLYRHQSHQHW
jgi:hypothetical protein